mgnify:CR=1 FL=1
MILYLNVADSPPIARVVVLHCSTFSITVTAEVEKRLLTVSSMDATHEVVVVDMSSRSGSIEVIDGQLIIDGTVVYEGVGDLQSVELPDFDPLLINYVEAL